MICQKKANKRNTLLNARLSCLSMHLKMPSLTEVSFSMQEVKPCPKYIPKEQWFQHLIPLHYHFTAMQTDIRQTFTHCFQKVKNVVKEYNLVKREFHSYGTHGMNTRIKQTAMKRFHERNIVNSRLKNKVRTNLSVNVKYVPCSMLNKPRCRLSTRKYLKN